MSWCGIVLKLYVDLNSYRGSNARSTLSALVNNNLTVKEPDDERQDLLQLRFDGERLVALSVCPLVAGAYCVYRFPWSTRAVDIRTHFEGLENYARVRRYRSCNGIVLNGMLSSNSMRRPQRLVSCPRPFSTKNRDSNRRRQCVLRFPRRSTTSANVSK